MEEKTVNILNEMAEFLDIRQLKNLQEVLLNTLSEEKVATGKTIDNEEYLK